VTPLGGPPWVGIMSWNEERRKGEGKGGKETQACSVAMQKCPASLKKKWKLHSDPTIKGSCTDTCIGRVETGEEGAELRRKREGEKHQ